MGALSSPIFFLRARPTLTCPPDLIVCLANRHKQTTNKNVRNVSKFYSCHDYPQPNEYTCIVWCENVCEIDVKKVKNEKTLVKKAKNEITITDL